MSRFGDVLAEKVLTDEYFKKIFISVVKKYTKHIVFNKVGRGLKEKEKSDIYRFINILINSNRNTDRSIAHHIISMMEPFHKNEDYFKAVSSTVFYKMGLFSLNIEHSFLNNESLIEAKLKMKVNEIQKTDFILTDAQSEIFSKMVGSSCFSFSGPTSLGKSFLINRMVERSLSSKKNIAIVVPSRALINQLTNELRSTLNQPILENNYKLQTNINGEETEEFNYIFILTPERLMNLHTRKTKVILDDLFVDEAHKLAAGSSRDSERSLTEYNAIELTIEKFRELNVYFSSPNISNPSMFLKLFGKNPFFSKHVKEAPVSQNIFLADTQKKTLRVLVNNEFLSLNSELLRGINSNDDFILNVGKGKHSNMVYCSSASNAVHYAVNFANKINSTELSDEIKSAINSISQLVHEQYYLVKCLEKRIAYHHGKLPHSVRGIIEELFRNGEIDFMFCTPTLAEGVNMPIKNIFIICEDKIRYTDDKEKNKVKSLSFWNLAGRAGRYRSELCGNVFCLNSETKSWDNNLSIFRDKSVNLESTIEKNIKKKATVKQLEDFLKNKDADDLKVEEVIKHLANIICIETLKFPEEYNKSNTLNLFIKANLLKIIKLAKKRAKEIKHLPMELLNSYRTLSLNLHDDVFQVVKFHQDDSVLPPFGYDKCHEVLETFHELYNWGEREKITISQLGYYNNLIYRWVSGNSINSIIRSTINYYEKERKSLYIYKGNELLTPIFDGSVEHVNHIIEVVFDDIENKLRFKLERYFNHYHKALTSILGEEKAGVNWAVFLEYGTQYPLVIEMQNLGLSRFTALNIYKNEALRKTLTLDAAKGGLQYNKKKLLSGFKEGSFEYKELSVLL